MGTTVRDLNDAAGQSGHIDGRGTRIESAVADVRAPALDASTGRQDARRLGRAAGARTEQQSDQEDHKPNQLMADEKPVVHASHPPCPSGHPCARATTTWLTCVVSEAAFNGLPF